MRARPFLFVSTLAVLGMALTMAVMLMTPASSRASEPPPAASPPALDTAAPAPQFEEMPAQGAPLAPSAAPDLSMVKSLYQGVPGAGRIITFSLYIYNYGNADAHTVVVTDVLPAATEFYTAYKSAGLAQNWMIVAAGNAVTFSTEILTRSTGAQLYVSARILASVAAGTSFTNTACASTTDVEGTSFANCDSDRVDVAGDASDLEILKTGAETAPPGGLVEYTLQYRNRGIATAANVIVSDTLPEGIEYVSADGAPTVNGRVVSWNRGTVNYAAYYSSVRVRGRVAETAVIGAQLVDQAAISTASQQSDVTHNSATFTTTVTAATRDVSVYKYLDGDGGVVAGRWITYNMGVRNGGNYTASHVVVTDVLPAGLAFISATMPPGWSYAQNGAVVTWTTSGMAAGDYQTLVLVAQVEASTPLDTVLVNWVCISTSDPETDYEDNCDSVQSTTISDKADMLTSKIALPSLGAPPDETLLYYAYYRNQGSATATDVIVTDTLPNGTTFVTVTDGLIPTQSGNQLVWQVGNVKYSANNRYLARVQIRVNSGMKIGTGLSNRLEVSTASEEQRYDNNVYTHTARVVRPTRAMGVSKSLAGGTPAAGQIVTYYLGVYNTGSARTGPVTVRDTLPAGMTFVTGYTSYAGWVVSAAGGVVTWQRDSMAPSGSASLYVVAQVSAGAMAGTVLTNTAIVSTVGQQTDCRYNTTVFTMTVANAADVQVRKTYDGRASPGLTYEYVVYHRNRGLPAENTTITDVLPTGVTLVEATGSPVVSGSRLVWSMGSQPYRHEWEQLSSVTVRVNGDIALGTRLTNVVTITTSSPETIVTNNTATVVVTAEAAATDLSVSKSWQAGVPKPGGTYTYSIGAGNYGNLTATNVVVTDALPAGTTFITGYQPTGWSVSHTGGVVTWSKSQLAPEDYNSLDLVVSVDAGALVRSLLTNTVGITSSEADFDPADNVDYYILAVAPALADMEVLKWAPSTVPAGQRLSYSLNFSNLGGEIAEDVVITDRVPMGAGISDIRFNNCPVTPTAQGGIVWLYGPVEYLPWQSGAGVLSFIAPMTVGTPLTNTIVVSTTSAEYDETNNQYRMVTWVDEPPPPPRLHTYLPIVLKAQ